MADQGKHWVPSPPGGLHGPSIEGSGHILDPNVRREIRELLVPALQDAFRDLAAAFVGMGAGGGPPIGDLLPQPPAQAPSPPAHPAPPAPPAAAAAVPAAPAAGADPGQGGAAQGAPAHAAEAGDA